MKKLLTKEEQDKKKKRNQLILGLVLIGLMLFSTAGYALSDREDSSSNIKKINYNGIDFIKDSSDYWRFSLNGYDFITQYNPEETKEIKTLGSKLLADYNGKPLYFSGEAVPAFSEIERNIGRFALRTSMACLSENCSGDYPIKSCSEDNIIAIQITNDSLGDISQDTNCIFINSNELNQTKYADAVLFEILGI
jgi:hypothetical protein